MIWPVACHEPVDTIRYLVLVDYTGRLCREGHGGFAGTDPVNGRLRRDRPGKRWVAGVESRRAGTSPQSTGLGPGGVALRSPTPATRDCYLLLNQAQMLMQLARLKSS